MTSGDSWTSCWPLEERLGHRQFGWPNLVSQHFGFQLLDKSRAGSSNYRIYRKTFDSILNQECDLAIVCLTYWVRFETGSTFGEKPGRIYQHFPKREKSEDAYRLFFNGYKNYTDMLRQIISLQTLSATKNIPCYFLDTYTDNLIKDISLEDFKKILSYNQLEFDNMDDDRICDKLDKVKMLTSKINFDKFISLDSYQKIISKCVIEMGHPVEDGHQTISSFIIRFLESNCHAKTF